MAVGSRAIKAGEAFVSMMLDDEEFANAIDDYQRRFDQLGRRLAPLAQSMAALGAAMTAPFAIGVRNLLGLVRQMDLSANRLGMATNEFAALATIAKLTGVELEAIEIGMKTIGERLQQLQEGSSETTVAFEELLGKQGVLQFISNPNMMERFLMIADGMQRLGDAGKQSGIALRALGEAGNRLLILLRLPELREFVTELRGLVPPELAQRARQLGIQWELLKLVFSLTTAQLASALVPWMLKTSEVLTQLLMSLNKWAQDNPTYVRMIAVLGGVLATLGSVMLSTRVFSALLVRTLGTLQPITWALTAAFSALNTQLVIFEFHVSGIGVRFAPWLVMLSKIAAMSAVVGASFSWVTGITNPLKILTGVLAAWPVMWSMILEKVGMLPDSLRRVRNELVRWLFENGPDALPEIAAATSPTVPAVAGTTTTGGPTSGIAARFASQRTLGFSADFGQQMAHNTAQTAANTAISNEFLADLTEIMRANLKVGQ